MWTSNNCFHYSYLPRREIFWWVDRRLQWLWLYLLPDSLQTHREAAGLDWSRKSLHYRQTWCVSPPIPGEQRSSSHMNIYFGSVSPGGSSTTCAVLITCWYDVTIATRAVFLSLSLLYVLDFKLTTHILFVSKHGDVCSSVQLDLQ